ncbi:MAG: DUF2147 domain-containing protein [Alphaproteobacteria bacterium]|nr:MAG: DUF2147 domain-containing protein [Alphaproteobacteria bacterium]
MKRMLLGGALAMALAAPAFAADPATGVWRTEPGNEGGYLFVRIEECGKLICGTIVGAVDSEGKKDPEYEHLGKPIIKGMKPDGDGRYSGGTIWAPDDDKTYSSKMRLKSPKVLEVSGCVLGGLFCRSQDWTRVK